MPKAVIDTASFTLRRKEDGVWLEHPHWMVRLGDYDAVCDEMCRFLEAEELGEAGCANGAFYG